TADIQTCAGQRYIFNFHPSIINCGAAGSDAASRYATGTKINIFSKIKSQIFTSAVDSNIAITVTEINLVPGCYLLSSSITVYTNIPPLVGCFCQSLCSRKQLTSSDCICTG